LRTMAKRAASGEESQAKAPRVESKVTVVLGSQWGDEGKGKIVDVLCADVDVVARCQGGNNAGHTLVVGGKTFKFHLLPSGLIHPKTQCVVGNGTVVHLPSFFEEVRGLTSQGIEVQGRLFLSDRAHMVFDFHQIVDGLRERERAGAGGAIGTTKKGIGPTYSSKANRSGIRICDLKDFAQFETKYRKALESKRRRFGAFEFDEEKDLARYRTLAKDIEPYVRDTIVLMNDVLKAGKSVIVEGANAAMLDLDFGTYPFVTSSNCTAGGACTGLGISPFRIGTVIGVIKAYTTRVGEGPFPTECLDAVGEHLQTVGHERGTTTGRNRRCGWLDLVVMRYSTMLNEYTALNLTKLDVLSGLKEIKVGVSYTLEGATIQGFPASLDDLGRCVTEYKTFPGWDEDITGARKFEDLPLNARTYIDFIAEFLGVPIKYIGVGPDRDATIFRD